MIRNSGATTRQMLDAPKGAVYIWVERRSIFYANALANHLNRGDLEIIGKQALDDGGVRLLGRSFSAIIVDHACELTMMQLDTLAKLRERVRKVSA